MGGVPIPRLILDHLPFVVEFYQGPKKNGECPEMFSDAKNNIKILIKAVEKCGITVMGTMSATEGETMLDCDGNSFIPCLRIPPTIRENELALDIGGRGVHACDVHGNRRYCVSLFIFASDIVRARICINNLFKMILCCSFEELQ